MIWRLTTLAVILACIYFVGIVALSDYLKVRNHKIWTVTYEDANVHPEVLPFFFLNIAGLNSSFLTPYSVYLKKKTDEGVKVINYCNPELYVEDCWGSSEVFNNR